MRVTRTRRLQWSAIALPGNWRSLIEEDVLVDGRPVSDPERVPVEDTGKVRLPLVRRSGGKWEIVMGLDRAVAARRANATGIDVDVLECTDAQAETLRSADRGNEMVANTARDLVQLLTYVNEKHATPKTPKREGSGRPRTVRGVARALIADELGVTPEAIIKAEQRARIKAGKELPPLWDYRIDQPQDWKDYADEVRVTLIEAQEYLLRATRAMESLDKHGIERLGLLVYELKALGQKVLDLRPRQVCPYCKNQPQIRERCGACVREGWVGQINEYHVPHQLLGDDPLFVSIDGQLRRINVKQRPVPTTEEPAESLDDLL